MHNSSVLCLYSRSLISALAACMSPCGLILLDVKQLPTASALCLCLLCISIPGRQAAADIPDSKHHHNLHSGCVSEMTASKSLQEEEEGIGDVDLFTLTEDRNKLVVNVKWLQHLQACTCLQGTLVDLIVLVSICFFAAITIAALHPGTFINKDTGSICDCLMQVANLFKCTQLFPAKLLCNSSA